MFLNLPDSGTIRGRSANENLRTNTLHANAMKIQAECVGELIRQCAATPECAPDLWTGALLEGEDLGFEEAEWAACDLEPAAM
jgi:hypothetical protein